MAEYNVNQSFAIPERMKGSLDGKSMMPIIEVLNYQMDDFFNDAPAKEANAGLHHQYRRETGVPAGTQRTFYSGVAASRPTTQVVLEPVGLMESRSEIDIAEIDTVTNGTEERRQRDLGNLKGLAKSILTTFVRGSKGASTPDQVDGIETRLNSLTGSPFNCVSAGGSSALTSILIVEWDLNNGAYLTYPSNQRKGTTYGISAVNRGIEPVRNTSNEVYYAYVTQFIAWLGLCVADELKTARICNVESAINATYGFAAAIEKMIQVLNNCHFDYQKTRIYVNEALGAQIDNEARQIPNHLWGTEEIFGRKVRTFQQIPVRIIGRDILTNSESAVT